VTVHLARVAAAAVAVAALALVAQLGGAAARETAPEPRVAAFFYPWYGTPQHDGAWRHWDQRGAQPPARIASAFYPSRGAYSSGDARVLAAQMRELRAAGVDDVVVSWWGRGEPEDARLHAVAAAARSAGLTVAAHLEPYAARTAATAARDIEYLQSLGIGDVYVYGAQDQPAESWHEALDHLTGVRVFAQTSLVGFAARAGFEGVYTYDVLAYGPATFARLCGQARRAGLLCAPSVGPGFDARRAVGETRVKPRRAGATYDGMWRSAIRARPAIVTITSYNEWHEGTQIEPAQRRRGYRSYEGAWGLHGRAAERAFLDRTAEWSARFRARAAFAAS
jgi:hypothetical protein